MTSITELYNNIKTFVLQTFESKEEEDINLPIKVERLFRYINGEMLIVSPIISELSNNIMKLKITGNSFSTNSSTPFTYNGKVFVDWGDNTGLIEYTGGKLTHTYSNSDNYTVKIYGDITSLDYACFYGCTGLTSIVIPNSVTSIGMSCFYNCRDLTSINIPNDVTSLENYCFLGCGSLTSINIPNGVTNLGNSCFHSCTGLTSITIPNSVTSLGASCFYGCTGLTSIEIPSSVTFIGTYCLANCYALTSIKLNWNTSTNILTYSSSWIYNTSQNLLFHIPNNTTSLYTAKEYPSDKLLEVGD